MHQLRGLQLLNLTIGSCLILRVLAEGAQDFFNLGIIRGIPVMVGAIEIHQFGMLMQDMKDISRVVGDFHDRLDGFRTKQ